MSWVQLYSASIVPSEQQYWRGRALKWALKPRKSPIDGSNRAYQPSILARLPAGKEQFKLNFKLRVVKLNSELNSTNLSFYVLLWENKRETETGKERERERADKLATKWIPNRLATKVTSLKQKAKRRPLSFILPSSLISVQFNSILFHSILFKPLLPLADLKIDTTSGETFSNAVCFDSICARPVTLGARSCVSTCHWCVQFKIILKWYWFCHFWHRN